jgi:lipopolysaccharide transport system ATP-binding protein
LKPILEIKNISKKFRIKHNAEAYLSLRDSLSSLFKSNHAKSEDFWALKEVSFEVNPGESLGIIGKNGAGKSTLLKILSRITPPTSGKIISRGRIASLLEVGTGFHPELSGRENIFLNGSILGMKQKEIEKKFDEIVDFSGVEKFLDTPLKHYSSGMQLRLAFAVAAFLEPEVLVIDEVLAVGDADFQKKCLGKMESVSRSGRTILFVSHNMPAVRQLCSRCVLIKSGMVAMDAETEPVVEGYLGASHVTPVYVKKEYTERKGTQEVIIEEAELHNASGMPAREFSIGDDIRISFIVNPVSFKGKVKLAVQLRTSDGINLANMTDADSNFITGELAGRQKFSLTLRDIRFYPDIYYFSVWVGSVNSMDVYDHIEDCVSFHVLDGGRLTARSLPRSAGLLFLTPGWKQEN